MFYPRRILNKYHKSISVVRFQTLASKCVFFFLEKGVPVLIFYGYLNYFKTVLTVTEKYIFLIPFEMML